MNTERVPLSEYLRAFRIDRPSEWQMDSFIERAEELQKRIEELEEVISKKDEALTNLLKEAKVLAILAHKHHAADCSYADVLPTGIGTWGCSCGLDSIVLDGELMNDFQYESALALKAGDVQAPKEGWKLVPLEATREMINAAYKAETKHAIRDYKRTGGNDPQLGFGAAYKAMIAAAPTDTEGK